MTYGELGYEAYRTALLARNQRELPPWEELNDGAQASWLHAASVVAAAVTRDMGNAFAGSGLSERP